jgi:small-conductance mechanosensitive channel
MKETELRNELNETVKDTKNLSQLIQSNIKAIDRLGRELLEELRQIRGWENMILHCKDHYEQYPDQFFEWCYVEYSYAEPIIKFVKRYPSDNKYTVLTIRLDMELAEQVMKANEGK